MGRLDGKVAVITGTGDGMGRTAALRFAEEGAQVVGCDINEQTAAETLELVRKAGGEMDCLYPLDLSDEKQAHRLMKHAAERHGKIDILYNNAMQMRLGNPQVLTLEDWNFTLTHTLTIGWLATKHAIPRFSENASVIFIASGVGVPVGTGLPGNITHLFPYAVAKSGVIRMSVLLATELASRGVRVNCISPGPVGTPVGLNVYGEDPDTPRSRLFRNSSLSERIGKPEDIVNAALFLASEEASWVTGHNLAVDGGYLASGAMGRPDPEAMALLDEVTAPWITVDDQWD
jgi:meso-butanediol dehydrogenase/(S,S)-butanediol dehydrogenase/diacetyl reductase